MVGLEVIWSKELAEKIVGRFSHSLVPNQHE